MRLYRGPLLTALFITFCALPVARYAVAESSAAARTPARASVDNYVLLFDARAYGEKVLPAYKAFSDRGDTAPLISLLGEVIAGLDQTGRGRQGPRLESKEIYEEAVGILDGSVYYDTRGAGTPAEGARPPGSRSAPSSGTASATTSWSPSACPATGASAANR